MKNLNKLAAAVIMAAALLPVAAVARTGHALLVGVNEHPMLAPGAELSGPGHDVARMREFLLSERADEFRPENVRVLCCGLEGEEAPTLGNIVAALDALAQKANAGDMVHIHFSGHGAQQPASGADMPDGVEEILLPADAGPWSDGEGMVRNALRKAELRRVVEALGARGAFVILTFDASFAPAQSAPVDGGEVSRSIEPERLGLSRDRLAAAAAPARRGLLRAAPVLGIVEKDGNAVVLVAGRSGEPTTEFEQRGIVQGLFTAALIEAWESQPNATARQISEKIIQAYGASARRRPTPGLEGAVDTVLGPALSASAPGAGGDQQVDFTVRVALPPRSPDIEGVYDQVLRAIESAGERSGDGFFASFVEAGDPADVRLAVLRREQSSDEALLWLLPPSGELARDPGFEPPALAIDDGLPDRLRQALSYVYRSAVLGRLASLNWGEPAGLSVAFQVVRSATLAKEPTQAGEIPAVSPGDQLHVTVSNESNSVYDLNLVYLGADHSLAHMLSERLRPGLRLELPLLEFTDSSFGRERLAIIVSEVQPQRPLVDLGFLDQEEIRAAPASDSGTLGDFIRQMALGRGNPRIAVTEDMAASGSISVRQFDVLP